jgi:hypothetical protein
MLAIEQRARAEAHRQTVERARILGGLGPRSELPPDPNQAHVLPPMAPGFQPYVGPGFQPPLQFQNHPPGEIPASVRNLITQERNRMNEVRLAAGRERDQMGRSQDTEMFQQTSSGRASPSIQPLPEHTTTHTRHHIGPNGERWQVTVNETTSFVGQQPHHNIHHHVPHNPANPVENLQSILRNADRILAARNLQNNMQQIAATGQPIMANSASLGHQQPGNNQGSASAAVPTLTTSTNSPAPSMPSTQPPNANIHGVAGATLIPANPGSIDPMVYLLSSPQGPRALLLSNSETFYTPRQPSRRRQNASPNNNQPQTPDARVNAAREMRDRMAQYQNELNARNLNGQNNQAIPAQPVAANAHVNAGAAAQRGPMIWLVVRLAVFVWFFTSGNSSWTRFLLMSALAVGVFVYNTGLLNGVAEQVWGPIRRHVEALIPLAGPVPPPPAAQNQPVEDGAAPARRPGEPDPAVVAARLIEQHRAANAGWLMTQIRRAEHAALLFLASLVPGVGERHIAAREAETAAALAERQRQIDAEAMATAAAQNEASAAENEDQQNSPQADEGQDVPPLVEV